MFRVDRRVRCGVGRGGKYAIAGAVLSLAGVVGLAGPLYAQDVFEPTKDSLRAYACPVWFRDAKFGIYVHWGPTSVPAIDGWYARNMYVEGHRAYRFHLKTYGHPSVFGYKDIIPLWKAERFDPDRLVALFKRAGAKYFTPCAVHHDNFDLWDSQHHKWNSVNMGPKKDITGLWREAALKHGLRFGITTHLARSYSWFNTNKGKDQEGPLAGVPYDGNDPTYQDLYFEPHGDTDLRHPRNPPESWRRNWARRIKDLIDRYQPDHIYFDGAIALAWPKEELVVKCLGLGLVGKTVRRVRLLGHGAELAFAQCGGSLKVKAPSTKPCEHAYALAIEFGTPLSD